MFEVFFLFFYGKKKGVVVQRMKKDRISRCFNSSSNPNRTTGHRHAFDNTLRPDDSVFPMGRSDWLVGPEEKQEESFFKYRKSCSGKWGLVMEMISIDFQAQHFHHFLSQGSDFDFSGIFSFRCATSLSINVAGISRAGPTSRTSVRRQR